ncbi:hypothetical protein GLOTRDRAFT_93426 [Gloeophyllum trabeum ATCC 11539]|uniref:Uncharacterized protein n=1 Tax=Gloeophyllum trabeum (strain ATCC 11539 / FP-39264 / Madison 617) TaxID=670483 RepID=S7Q7B4_GLOTA|nr:uncharacterized protein GLOTRDRAFT_93426 [Gloeophyllum trabeum ATCC 11539]EPQ55901.1 hypothetical protein GLOTRDRAFT_93426 [Gloeophyllum trabeum ATCC 11539]
MYSLGLDLFDFAAVKRLVFRTFSGGNAPPQAADQPLAWVKTVLTPTRTLRGTPTTTYGAGSSGTIDSILALIIFITASFFLFTSVGPLRRQGDGAVFTVQWSCELLSFLILIPQLFSINVASSLSSHAYHCVVYLIQSSLRVASRPLQLALFLVFGLQDLHSAQVVNEKVILTSALLSWFLVISSAFHLSWSLLARLNHWHTGHSRSAISSLVSAGVLVASWIALHNLEHKFHLNAVPRRGQEGMFPMEAHMTSEAVLMALEAWTFTVWYCLGIPNTLVNSAGRITKVVPAPFSFALIFAVVINASIQVAARCIKTRVRKVRSEVAFILLSCRIFTKVPYYAKYHSGASRVVFSSGVRRRSIAAPVIMPSVDSNESLFGGLRSALNALKEEREEDYRDVRREQREARKAFSCASTGMRVVADNLRALNALLPAATPTSTSLTTDVHHREESVQYSFLDHFSPLSTSSSVRSNGCPPTASTSDNGEDWLQAHLPPLSASPSALADNSYSFLANFSPMSTSTSVHSNGNPSTPNTAGNEDDWLLAHLPALSASASTLSDGASGYTSDSDIDEGKISAIAAEFAALHPDWRMEDAQGDEEYVWDDERQDAEAQYEEARLADDFDEDVLPSSDSCGSDMDLEEEDYSNRSRIAVPSVPAAAFTRSSLQALPSTFKTRFWGAVTDEMETAFHATAKACPVLVN